MADTPNFDDATSEAFDTLFGETDQDETVDQPEPDDTEQPDEGQDGDGLDAEDGSDGEDTDEEAADQDDDADDDEQSDPDVIELSNDATVRLEDGTELKIGEAVLKDADYTQKTQKLADDRRQFESDREQFDGEREKVRTFIDRFESDTTGVLGQLIGSTSNPTLATAQLIKKLADEGLLEEDFARVFVGENATVQQRAAKADEQDRLDRMEKRIEERDRESHASKQREETVATYERQWSNVVVNEGLEFESRDAEQAHLREVLQYAVDNEITNLEKAYGAFAWERERERRAETAESEQHEQQARVKKTKRSAQAMTPRSANAGRSKKPKPVSTEAAVADAFDALTA